MAKNIVLVCLGSRGDVQPYCVVGAALTAQGHHVCVAAEKRLAPLVAEFGLAFRPLEGDICGAMFDDVFYDRFRHAKLMEFVALLDEWSSRFDKRAILASFVAALSGADIVISGSLCCTESYSVAEAMGATWIPLFLGNRHLPTNEFAHWLLESYVSWLFGFANKWSHSFVWSTLWSKQQVLINEWRQTQLHLPPIEASTGILDSLQNNDAIVVYQAASLLYASPSRRLPLDFAPGKVVYTGFLFSPIRHLEPAPLQAFLDKTDSPVIYIGFGSMPTLEPTALLQLAVDVCKVASCRCVLAAGWSSMAQPGFQELADAHADTVYVETASISHVWLFPQLSCLLHHAGMGTSAAALRSARVPQVPCPVGVDQYHNANELIALGVALTSISKAQLSTEYVARAVQAVLNNEQDVQAKARDVAAYVVKESEGALDRLCASIIATKPTFQRP